jgi:hypothetical protein
MGALWRRLAWVLFYISLDVLIGAITYIVSHGEADLTSGELMIRIMTAILLANGIVGGPDIMLYWRESGRRIEAERKLGEERKLRDKAEKERDEAVALIPSVGRAAGPGTPTLRNRVIPSPGQRITEARR